MPEILYARGLPGSGKSTWAIEAAHDPGWKRVNNDDLRLMFDGIKFDPINEDWIAEARKLLCHRILDAGFNLIIDNCNLSPKAVDEIHRLASQHGTIAKEKDFRDVPLDVCIERDKARGSKAVGERVIRRMAKQFLNKDAGHEKSWPQRTYEPVAQDPLKPLAVIFDIDGTLADHGGIRGHYEYGKVHLDKPHCDIIELVTTFRLMDYAIIFLSGRDGTDECAQDTAGWLKANGSQLGDLLLMRAAGDRRPDDIIKREILERDVLPNYYVKYVFDDRDRVVSMWRQSGLRCLQVAEGNF